MALTDNGVSYIIEGAPFEFKYSYTETPKVKPLRLREPPYAPFGPATMGRPWTGRAPLPPSKKKLKEFDSFKLPPPGKKGVKPVQAPGPYMPGTGPRYVRSREEILGEPLTKEEVRDLVKGCMKSQRQLNMGRRIISLLTNVCLYVCAFFSGFGLIWPCYNRIIKTKGRSGSHIGNDE